ncbi:MAG TPA: hypothetical protein VF605_19935 [Allosphingosinicella sp.]
MAGLRLYLAAAWLAVAAVTLWALATLGLSGLIATLAADLRQPWRAQLDSDLEAHLLLFAGWIGWRHRWRPRGLLAGLAVVLLGALFTLPYLLAASFRASDVRGLLLGERR